MINNILEKLKQKNDLNNNELETLYEAFKKKSVSEEEIKDLVILWREKGETPFELSALANLINSNQRQSTKYQSAVDICGTGGDKLNTFNISTLTAVIASSIGIKVIKHSGRSNTGISGSVDVLNDFGIDIDINESIKESCFRKTDLMFTSSKHLREVFTGVKSICKKLGIPGFVNLLGPLTNPYETSFHLLGVSNIKWGNLLSETLIQSENFKKDIIIVCSKISENIFLDEFSFCGVNHIWQIHSGKEIIQQTINSEEFGLPLTDIEDLKVKDKFENKLVFESVLKGKSSSTKEKECVKAAALNTGAVMLLTKRAGSIKEGYETALKQIQSGIGWEHFQNFINSSK